MMLCVKHKKQRKVYKNKNKLTQHLHSFYGNLCDSDTKPITKTGQGTGTTETLS